jgi:hypothetical protein
VAFLQGVRPVADLINTPSIAAGLRAQRDLGIICGG